MAVAAGMGPSHLVRRNDMSTKTPQGNRTGGATDDRSARLPRAVRNATVTGAETADAAQTAATSTSADAARNDGPGGYAPTVVPDDDTPGGREGVSRGEGKGPRDDRRPPPLGRKDRSPGSA